MSQTKIKNRKSSLFLPLLLIGSLLIHIGITYSVLPDKLPLLVCYIHIYLFSFLVLSMFLVKKVKSIDETKVGLTFLALTLFKMMFAIGFLLVMFSLFPIERIIVILHFFAPFFLYLIIEVLLTLKEIR